jgi:hypothetical protein
MKNSDLLKRSGIYDAILMQMVGYQNAYLGGYVFKQSVRKKRPSEDSQLWNDLIKNTVAQPVCRYIVDTINDVLFEPGVKRNLKFATPDGRYIDPNNCDWVDLFINDADLQTRSLTGFMEQIGDLTSIFGHCWCAVDLPTESEGSLGRPYACAISPLNVWDWEFDFYGGRPILKYVKIKEMEDEHNYYLKCYYLGTQDKPSYWESYEVPKSVKESSLMENEARKIGEGVFPAGMSIPVFIAYGRKDPRQLDLGVSDIDSASDAMREHYKLECEKYTALQFAHTIIRADKGISIPVHAGAIVRALQGQVEAISVDTGDVDKIIKAQQDILEQIEALTGLGGLRNSKNQVASGVSIIEERKQLHRTAKSKARLMEVTEGLIFTFAARFMGMRWAGQVNYNTDYEAHDTNYRMALITQASTLVGDNEIIKSLITREIIGMLAPADDIEEYQQIYVDSLTDSSVKELMTYEDEQIIMTDTGSIPEVENYGEIDTESDEKGDQNNTTLLGGPGTPITPMGPSYYTQQAVAVQITGLNTGR